MIIFGTRGVTSTSDRGEFHCPQCGPGISFARKRVRRFFTLYFIPMIPLGQLGEYVECEQCQGTFNPGVLDYDPGADDRAFQAAFHHAIGRVMVLMMLADGEIDANEIETIREVYAGLASHEISEQDVLLEIERARAEGLGIEDYLGAVSGKLNDRGRELVVTAAYRVAAADGRFEQAEAELLDRIAKALMMTPAHYRGLIDSLREAPGV